MTTIFWAGDSTVKQNSIATYPQTGIAQAFDRFTKNCEVHIANCAENGRSTKSYLEEGRLEPIREAMRPGDFLFIQFGHNDEKDNDPERYADPDGLYRENLMIFARAAQEKGAIPVWITPVSRRNRTAPKQKWQHDRWANAVREMSRETGIAMIDLTAMSEQILDSMTEEETRRLYMNFDAGIYPTHPEASTDDTHLRPEGAQLWAEMIARSLLELGAPYADLLAEDAVEWLKAH